MPVITMKVPCTIENLSGHDVYGKPSFSAPRKSVCAILKLEIKREPSTVRADSSGTRGHANEKTADASLLMKAKENINLDDVIQIAAVRLRVLSIRPRYNVFSKIDHLEVEGSIE